MCIYPLGCRGSCGDNSEYVRLDKKSSDYSDGFWVNFCRFEIMAIISYLLKLFLCLLTFPLSQSSPWLSTGKLVHTYPFALGLMAQDGLFVSLHHGDDSEKRQLTDITGLSQRLRRLPGEAECDSGEDVLRTSSLWDAKYWTALNEKWTKGNSQKFIQEMRLPLLEASFRGESWPSHNVFMSIWLTSLNLGDDGADSQNAKFILNLMTRIGKAMPAKDDSADENKLNRLETREHNELLKKWRELFSARDRDDSEFPNILIEFLVSLQDSLLNHGVAKTVEHFPRLGQALKQESSFIQFLCLPEQCAIFHQNFMESLNTLYYVSRYSSYIAGRRIMQLVSPVNKSTWDLQLIPDVSLSIDTEVINGEKRAVENVTEFWNTDTEARRQLLEEMVDVALWVKRPTKEGLKYTTVHSTHSEGDTFGRDEALFICAEMLYYFLVVTQSPAYMEDISLQKGFYLDNLGPGKFFCNSNLMIWYDNIGTAVYHIHDSRTDAWEERPKTILAHQTEFYKNAAQIIRCLIVLVDNKKTISEFEFDKYPAAQINKTFFAECANNVQDLPWRFSYPAADQEVPEPFLKFTNNLHLPDAIWTIITKHRQSALVAYIEQNHPELIKTDKA